MFHNFITHTKISERHKESPNPQYICFEPYVTLTYLRQETHLKPYCKRVAIKTNCPSLSTEEQSSEYLFHFKYMLIPPPLLNALDFNKQRFDLSST
jgi:hypothetical protein